MPIQEELDGLKIEVAALAAKVGGEGPWYRNPSLLISVVALVFSFGTTVISSYNSHQEEIRANRRDVRAMLERLSKLPIDNYELMQKNKGTGQGEALSGMLNQENILLATQCAELIERFPGSFTSTEYFAVAFALSSSNIIGKVPIFYQRAMDLATTSNDYNAAARAYAGFLFGKGEYTEGKRLYREALGVWNKFPERNAYIVGSVDLVTLMYWAQSEFAVGNKAEAREKLAEARRKLAELAPGPYTDALRSQVEYTGRYID